jgi:SAM-dependent methyltransferase
MAAMTAGQTYIGSELEIFAQALNWKAYFSSLLSPFIGKRVLEVGTGVGATTTFLCDGSQDIWVCLEPDANLLTKAEANIRAHHLPTYISPYRGSVSTIDDEVMFDTVLYIDVLEHIADDSNELEQASRRLSVGGKLIVLAHAYPLLFSPFDQSIGHFRRYIRKSLSTLTPSSCEILCMMNLDSVGLLTSLANRFFLHRSLPTQEQVLFWDRKLVPLSKFFDRLLRYRLGRSIICVWEKAIRVKV